ncbi:Ecr family regulatory small membrane protein [Klebsiella aerogenes]|nr:Ecr family regulatory small membrane protein [Klebsiella aerogenes]
MSKTEIFLLLVILLILGSALWFIFSDEIWILVSYLETLLYPSLIAPE